MKFIRKGLNALLDKKAFASVDKYIDSSNQIFFKFLASQFLDAVVVGFLVAIALGIMDIKYAPLLGFMIGLFNMIPYFGAIFGIAISVLITLITGGATQALWMLVVVVILQQIDANIINPKIVGDSLKISPLLIILSVTIGGAYFGVLGMFLAVPIAAVLKIVVNDYLEYKEKNSEKIN
ncbi:AI-2 transport protein TqsA [compost metagenome]